MEGAQRGEIRRVVQVDFRAQRNTTAQHYAITGTSANRENQRRRLQRPDPDRIQPLVINAEWGEKSAGSHRDVRIGDKVQLQVVNFFINLSAVRPSALRTREFAFELRA